MRFFRVGKKNQPAFKIVVTDKRNPPRGGRFVEQVGFYNPLTKEKLLEKERVQYWIQKGAQPSPTVYNLLIKEGVFQGKKIAVHKKSKKPASADASAGKPVPAATPAPAVTVAPVAAPAAPVAPAEPAVPAEPLKEAPKTE